MAGKGAFAQRRVGFIVLLALTASIVIPIVGAEAATTYQVVVGKYLVPDASWATSTRFFPSTIQVHQNDILHFNSELLETATLLPAGEEPGPWVKANWKGKGKTWSLFQADPNDGPTATRMNLRVMSPSDPCGWPTQDPCEYDAGGAILNSGLALFPGANGFEKRQLDYRVVVTAAPGTTFYALSLTHPNMRMKIEVVGAEVDPSDPDALTADEASKTAADLASAKSLNKKYIAKRENRIVNGTKVWKAWAGVDTPTVSLLRMYPAKLPIKKGEFVKWNFRQLVSQAHTVTFPLSKALENASSSPSLSCEANGVDSAPTSDSYPFCEDPAALELEVAGAIAKKAGDGVYSGGTDYESSGVRGGGFATSKKSYMLKFTKRSNLQGFTWGCMVHDIGEGLLEKAKVVVK